MEVLNYTGKRIGVANEQGRTVEVLPPHGFARLEKAVELKLEAQVGIGRIPIYKKGYSKVRGLPSPDLNLEKLYIVSKEVAEAAGNTRFDLLVGEEPFNEHGAICYKHLINV